MARKSLQERFEEKYVPVPETGCWIWIASTFLGGYGCIRVDGKIVGAHRLSYELHNGPIPEELHVLHRCDQPPCVRPDHLFLGTHQDNMIDRTVKGRDTSKLTSERVLEIFYAEGPQREIAANYGVSQSLVSTIKTRKRWKHIHKNPG